MNVGMCGKKRLKSKGLVDSNAVLEMFFTIAQQIDRWLFYAVNHGWSNVVFDWLFVAITTTRHWYPVWAVMLVWLVWKGGRGGRWCAATLVVLIALLDPLSHHFLKETVHRLRPFAILPDAIQLVGTGGGSFPSNHAMNNAAMSTVLWAYYPRLRWLFVTVVVLVCISRVYCGVHWPSDVVAGAAIGVLAGLGMVSFTRWWKGVPE